MNVLKKLYSTDERSWGTGICSFKSEEFEIIEALSRDYAVQDLCALMGVSRSGYYKWKNREKSERDIHREEMIALVNKVHYRKHKIKDKYPNLIFTTWDTVDRPGQVIVSDMTVFKFWILYFEVTFYFDVFTKEILTYRIASRKGDRNQYIDGLKDVKDLLKGHSEPVVLHTDQGSIYASYAYNELIKDSVIVRSMSRAGKPTDNPVN